tara:strand:+ start:247 stop:423 length:177 start_codon:yes stop_codon:yes gene_type:complete
MPEQMKTKNLIKKPVLKKFKKKWHRPILLGKIKKMVSIMGFYNNITSQKRLKKVEQSS